MATSKSNSGPRGLAQVLGTEGVSLVRRATGLARLDEQLRPLLPSQLAAHARLANVDGETLVFITDSPVWKSRMRLSEADLLAAAQKLGLRVNRVVVKIATAPLPPDQLPEDGRPVTGAARNALEEIMAMLAEPKAPPPQAPGAEKPRAKKKGTPRKRGRAGGADTSGAGEPPVS